MPAAWRAELKGLVEAQREATRIATELSGAPMVNATRDATLVVTGGAKRFAHTDTGRWRASITPEVRVMGQQVVGVVGSNLAYGPFAHEDTRPHWPPIAAIQTWVHRKGIGGTVRGQGRIARASASVERSIAFLIARKISRRGTKGDQAIYRSLQENTPRIVALFNAAVRKITRS